MKILKIPKWAPAACGLALSLAAFNATARPYASAVKTEGGVVSFTLNESADNVQVIFNGGVSTNNLGALNKGVHTFNLGANSSFEIHVSKNGGLGYQHADATGTNAVVNKISSSGAENPLLTIYSPRGVAVNKNPASPYFGRIYVGNGSGGQVAATGRFTDVGIFTLNPDETSAHSGDPDTALNPGFRMVGSGSSPFELMIAEDDQVYIADWTDTFGNVLVANPEITQVGMVLKELVSPAVVPVGEGNTHGSINAVHVEGSFGNNLVVYTIDEDLQPNKTTSTATHRQSLWRYDIGTGTLPSEVEGSLVFAPGQIPNTGLGGFAQTFSMVRAANGYFYITSLRAEGTDTSGLIVLDQNGSVLWNSRTASTNLIGGTRDILRGSSKVAVTTDLKFVAVARNQNIIWIIPLVNGIPDLTQRLVLPAFGQVNTLTASHMRGIAFDAANNLYAVNTRDEILSVFAPGGTATTVTTSDGTFQTVTPGSDISVTASIPTTTEGSTAGRFTLNRAGETSGSLTVSFTIGGTAINGVDYVTIATNATFAPGVSSINIDVTPINDSIAEFTETVTLTLSVSENYAVVSPSSATVSILDNEPAEISISAIQPTLLEGYAFSKATYEVTRRGLIGSALTVNLNYSGSAGIGVDFNGPTTVNVASGAATATFDITPVNNSTYHGDRTINAAVVTGTGYVVGTPSSAQVTLVDDEFPAGSVVFSDDFNDAIASSSKWTVNASDANEAAIDFGFDYSALGVPPAPNSSGNTIGARMRVSFAAGSIAAVNMIPNGLNLSGDYRLIFDSWINFNGPLAAGGAGSTQSTTAGAGVSTTDLNWRFGTSRGAWFSWNGDGGTGLPTTGANAGYRDYNAYSGSTWFDEASGVYAAGTGSTARNRGDSYYALWGRLSAPTNQFQLGFSSQTGQTSVGTFGMAWHRVAVTKIGNNVTWTIDGRPIATIDAAAIDMGNNVFVGYEDVYPGASSVPDMSFALVDNLRVETIVATLPTITISRNGNSVTLTWTGGFTLQEASTLTGSPSDWSNIGASSGYTVDSSSGIKFYRLIQQ